MPHTMACMHYLCLSIVQSQQKTIKRNRYSMFVTENHFPKHHYGGVINQKGDSDEGMIIWMRVWLTTSWTKWWDRFITQGSVMRQCFTAHGILVIVCFTMYGIMIRVCFTTNEILIWIWLTNLWFWWRYYWQTHNILMRV